MAIKISMGLPPEVARRFVADMDAYHNEPNPIKQEEIACASCMLCGSIASREMRT